MIAVIGVRISWLMFARNSLLARLAASALPQASSSLWFVTARASEDCLSNCSAFILLVMSTQKPIARSSCTFTASTDKTIREPSLRTKQYSALTVEPVRSISWNAAIADCTSSGATMSEIPIRVSSSSE